MEEIIYNTIGQGYNKTRIADAYITNQLHKLLDPNQNSKYLDVGCGTGNYTESLFKLGVNIQGLDPSNRMLEYAINRNKDIEWKLGSVENIPYPEHSFDGVLATLTIHHWSDLELAFKELDRVLTDEGIIVIFTSSPEQMNSYWLNHYFPTMLRKSIEQMPSIETIEKALLDTNFKLTSLEKYFVKDDLQDHFLYVGKNRPELYLDEEVRAGISSFSNLATEREVEIGLSGLKMDIENREILKIISEYWSDLGDYSFLKIEKKSNN